MLAEPEAEGQQFFNRGASVCKNFRVLGLAPAAASGAVDVPALFSAKFGQPNAGRHSP